MSSGNFFYYPTTNLGLYCTYLTEQDIINNRTKITINTYLDHHSINAVARDNSKIVCNGETYTYTSPAFNTTSTATTWMGSHIFYVGHNSDGTHSNIALSASWDFYGTYSGVYVGVITASTTIALDTIPRASSFSLSASSVNVGGTISATINRASSNFTHFVEWFIDSTHSLNYSNETTSSSTTIPESWYSEIPNSLSRTAYCRVTTYNGNTLIGSPVTQSFTINVPSSVVPTVGNITVTTAGGGIVVQGMNAVNVSVSGCKAGTGSSIVSYTYSGPSLSVSGAGTSATSGVVTASGTLTYSVTVKDARGRTATKTQTITSYAYSNPYFTSFNAYRCDQNGTANVNGTYLKPVFAATFSPVNNTNSVTVTVHYGNTTTVCTSGTPINLGNKDTTYNVYATLIDNYNRTATSGSVTVYGSANIINCKADGTGVAFGKKSTTSNLLESLWSIKTSGNMYSNGVYIGDAGNLDEDLRLYSKSDGSFYRLHANNGYMWLHNYPKGSLGNEIFSTDGTNISAQGKICANNNSTGQIIINPSSSTEASIYYQTNNVMNWAVGQGCGGVGTDQFTWYSNTKGNVMVLYKTGELAVSSLIYANGGVSVNSGDISFVKADTEQCIRFNDCSSSSWNVCIFKGNNSTGAVVGWWDSTNGHYICYYGNDQLIHVNVGGYLGAIKYTTVGKAGELWVSSDGECISPSSNGGWSLGQDSFRFYKLYSTTTTSVSSDRNVKKDIEDLDFNIIDDLRPVKFQLKDAHTEDDGIVHYGFIAQEVEEALAKSNIDVEESGIISFTEDKDTGKRSGYSLGYTEFIPFLTKKCQSLQTEVNVMKDEIDALKAMVQELLPNSNKTE